MKLTKFMIIDMLILTTFAIGSEYIGSLINKDMLYISFAQVFLLLIAVRWGYLSLIPITITSIARVLIFKAQGFDEMVIYFIPMFVMSLSILLLKTKLFKDLNESRVTGMSYFSMFYLLFMLTNGLLIKILKSSDYSFLNEIPKYLLSFILGNILYYLFVGQKTMTVNIIKTQKNMKESENDGYE